MSKFVLTIAILFASVALAQTKHWTAKEGIELGNEVCPHPVEATYHGKDPQLLKKAIEALQKQNNCLGLLGYCIQQSPATTTDIKDVRKCFDDQLAQQKKMTYFRNPKCHDATYVRKLTGKVRNEIVHDVDRATIEPRLAEQRENYRLMREELLKIVYWNPESAPQGIPKPLARDRVEAARASSCWTSPSLMPRLPQGCSRSP